MKTQCECPKGKAGPIRYGSFDLPVYVCGSCGKNLTIRVEAGEMAEPNDIQQKYDHISSKG